MKYLYMDNRTWGEMKLFENKEIALAYALDMFVHNDEILSCRGEYKLSYQMYVLEVDTELSEEELFDEDHDKELENLEYTSKCIWHSDTECMIRNMHLLQSEIETLIEEECRDDTVQDRVNSLTFLKNTTVIEEEQEEELFTVFAELLEANDIYQMMLQESEQSEC